MWRNKFENLVITCTFYEKRASERQKDKHQAGLFKWHNMDKSTDVIQDYGAYLRWQNTTVHVYQL